MRNSSSLSPYFWGIDSEQMAEFRATNQSLSADFVALSTQEISGHFCTVQALDDENIIDLLNEARNLAPSQADEAEAIFKSLLLLETDAYPRQDIFNIALTAPLPRENKASLMAFAYDHFDLSLNSGYTIGEKKSPDETFPNPAGIS